MIIYLKRHATDSDVEKARRTFGDYIKIVVDIDLKVATIGGKLHADGEEVLIKKGSKNGNLWGGGLDLKNENFDCQAVINIRPFQNNDSMEILDPEIRKKFIEIAGKLLK